MEDEGGPEYRADAERDAAGGGGSDEELEGDKQAGAAGRSNNADWDDGQSQGKDLCDRAYHERGTTR